MRNHIPNHTEGYVRLEDCLNLKRLTKHQKTGLPLELAQHNALYILGIKDNPNNFFDYAANQSTKEMCRIDNYLVRETDTTLDLFPIENKNGKEDDNMWSPSWIQEEIFDRRHKDERLQGLIRKAEKAGKKVTIHKLVVCSIFKGSRQSRWLMNGDGWKIIELGFQVTASTFKKAVGILVRKLYWIKKNFFDKPVQTHLTSYNKPKNSEPMYSYREISLSNCSIEGLYRRYSRDFNELNTVSSTEFRGYG